MIFRLRLQIITDHSRWPFASHHLLQSRMTFEQFQALPSSEQARFLASFAHALTIVAREGYDFESDGLAVPKLLRHINEIQHRVLGFLVSRLGPEPQAWHEEIFATMTKSNFPSLTSRLQWAFNRTCGNYNK